MSTANAMVPSADAIVGRALAVWGDGGEDGIVYEPGSPEHREQVERGATELARVYREATAKMRWHWAEFRAQCKALEDAMIVEGERSGHHFGVDLYHSGTRYWHGDSDGLDQLLKKFNVTVWALLIDRLGVKNLMSIKRREEFDRQVKTGDVPEVTEANILAVLASLADRASEFAAEAAKEALKLLTPASRAYKTNSGFKVGRRVILPWYVDQGYGASRFRVSHSRDAEVIAIDGTFHVLDEKGAIRDRKSPLWQAIHDSPDGRGETDYFRFKCFKNRNLHIEFKRLDLVKKLNGLATGEYVLGHDPD